MDHAAPVEFQIWLWLHSHDLTVTGRATRSREHLPHSFNMRNCYMLESSQSIKQNLLFIAQGESWIILRKQQLSTNGISWILQSLRIRVLKRVNHGLSHMNCICVRCGVMTEYVLIFHASVLSEQCYLDVTCRRLSVKSKTAYVTWVVPWA